MQVQFFKAGTVLSSVLWWTFLKHCAQSKVFWCTLHHSIALLASTVCGRTARVQADFVGLVHMAMYLREAGTPDKSEEG